MYAFYCVFGNRATFVMAEKAGLFSSHVDKTGGKSSDGREAGGKSSKSRAGGESSGSKADGRSGKRAHDPVFQEYRIPRKQKRDSSDSEFSGSGSDSGDTDSSGTVVGLPHTGPVRFDMMEVDLNPDNYEAFDPKKAIQDKTWKLDRKSREYAEKNFSQYLEESVVKPILDSNPRPNHSVFKAQELDPDVENGLLSSGNKAAPAVLKRDRMMGAAQEKVLRVMGPLGQLWRFLNEARKKNGDKMDVHEALALTEKSVLLLGQANVAVKYNRRYEIVAAVSGGGKSAKRILSRYKKHLKHKKKLFGAKFQKALEKDAGEESKKGLLSLQAKKPKQQRHYGRSEAQPPFRSNPNQAYSMPFRAGPPHNPSFGGRGRGFNRGQRSSRAGYSRRPARYVYFTSDTNKEQSAPGRRQRTQSAVDKSRSARAQSPGGSYPPGRQQRAQGAVDKSRSASAQRGSSIGPSATEDHNVHYGQGVSGIRELADSNVGQICFTNCSGLPNTLLSEPAHSGNERAKVFEDRDSKHNPRSREAHAERSRYQSGCAKRAICGASVPQREERRNSQTCVQFEEAEPVSNVPAFQDGGLSHAEKPDQTQRSLHEGGPKGRLLLCGNGGERQTIPQIQLAGQPVSVPVSPIRACISTEGFHKVDETDSGTDEKTGSQADHLPGRHSVNESEYTEAAGGGQHPLLSVGEIGISGQYGEISARTDAGDRISGDFSELQKDGTQSPAGKTHQSARQMHGLPARPESDGTANGGTDWNAVIDNGGSVASTTALQTPAVEKDKGSHSQHVIRGNSDSLCGMQRGATMVDLTPGTSKRPDLDLGQPRHGYRDRCQSNGLGSSVERKGDKRPVDSDRERGPDKCFGDEGNISGSEVFLEGHPESPRSCLHRQHDGSSTYQQNGGHKVAETYCDDKVTVESLPGETSNALSVVSAGKAEYDSRSVVSGLHGSQRLEVRSDPVHCNSEKMGKNGSRLVCQQDELPNPSVHQLEAGPRGFGHGCTDSVMERESHVCFSPLQPHQLLPRKGEERGSRGGVNNANMAHTTLVCYTAGNGISQTDPPPTVRFPSFNAIRECPPDAGEQDSILGGMENFREDGSSEQLSERAATLVASSRRPGTQASYHCSWQKWCGWCDQRTIDPIRASVANIIDFLAELSDSGLQYSTLNGYRSAISAGHEYVDGMPVGQHPLVKRALTGAFNLNPPRPKYAHTWDVNVVLGFIEGLGEDGGLSDKMLTYKLAMLIALTTANRASEIQAMNLEFMMDKGDNVVFSLPKITKTMRPGAKPHQVTLWEYAEKVLDVTHCLRTYIRRTAAWRKKKEQHQLLLGITEPHKPVKTCTISNWLKKLMAMAGIDTDTFTAHSVRGASTSKASQVGLSILEIMEQASWSNAKTFHKFYKREVPRPRFQDMVLQ